MHYSEEADTRVEPEEKRLILDGTASLDNSDDEPIPRVRGLIELLNQYFGNRRRGDERE